MEMVRNFFLKRNHTEVDVENMDIGILHILVSVVVGRELSWCDEPVELKE
jgi:hypothetical protein